MSYQGLTTIEEGSSPHLGGNAVEGDPFSFCPKVWEYMISRFSVTSMLDLGSGLGYSANHFHSRGVKVVAVDGLLSNTKKAFFPTLHVDLTKGSVETTVDLVHCQEVVEHIHERFMENIVSSLKCGRFILMSHALPGQGGYHHVNEKPPEYWIAQLQRQNCEVLVEDTNRVRKLAASEGATYLAKTGLVFHNRDRQ